MIPANKRKIPWQDDLDSWPHLKQVRIAHINTDVRLLIGTSVPKTMESEALIKSINDWPYVRIILGWTVNRLRTVVTRLYQMGYLMQN